MSLPEVSIIIPMYQAEAVVRHCLQQVHAQTFTQWELLLIDDGCRDSTQAVITAALTDPRVRLILHPNGGPSAARNLGLAAARGRYIYCMDADDLVHPQLLELAVATFQSATEETLDFVSFGSTTEGVEALEKDPPPPTTIAEATITPLDLKACVTLPRFRENPAVWYTLFRRDVIEAHHLRFCEAMRNLEDADFLFRYFRVARKGLALSTELYTYIAYPNSLSRGKKSRAYVLTLGCLLRRLTEAYRDSPTFKTLRTKAFPKWVKVTAKDLRAPEYAELRDLLDEELITLFRERCLGFKGFTLRWRLKLLPLFFKALLRK